MKARRKKHSLARKANSSKKRSQKEPRKKENLHLARELTTSRPKGPGAPGRFLVTKKERGYQRSLFASADGKGERDAKKKNEHQSARAAPMSLGDRVDQSNLKQITNPLSRLGTQGGAGKDRNKKGVLLLGHGGGRRECGRGLKAYTDPVKTIPT